jgi:hypothetical protein
MKDALTLKSVLVSGWAIIFIAHSCQNSEKKTSSLKSDRKALYENYCMPELADNAWYTSSKKAPLFRGLDGIHFKITAKSKEAGEYFNQGMMLAYGFNHAEAARSFYEAARLDTSCAMCQWGFAYVLGPNYNAGMEADNFQRAYDAVARAQKLSGRCTQKEKDLIHALAARYSRDAAAKRSALDSSYAAEMRKVYGKYPNDEDVAALFAESLMDLHPWDLFLSDGKPQPWTPEIIGVLENSLKSFPRHAGLNHFYIHAMEMSDVAEKAMPSAKLLEDLVPASGHLVHMPSHTYIRTGHYHEGTVTNIKSVTADSAYTEACHASGAYPLLYSPHNYHFLAACATLDGESRNAMIGAYQTKAHAYKKMLLHPYFATIQHFYSIPFFVEVKLGQWDEIRNTPEPDKELKYPRIIWNYAQGMAALAQNKPKKAGKYLDELNTIMKDTALTNMTIWGVNRVLDICQIASQSLEGELHAKGGDYEAAIRLLKSAITLEDQLKYQEPPDWFFSVRHNLGAVLIESGKYREAIEVYKEDLVKYPENGWALVGMMNAYNKLGDSMNYEDSKKRFDLAWKYADMKISSSRIL